MHYQPVRTATLLTFSKLSLRTALWLVLAGILSACSTPQYNGGGEFAALPRQAQITDVPFYPQEDLYCGPASLAMVLNWAGETVDQHLIAEQVFTPGREGTFRTDMITSARRHGKLATELSSLDDLLAELDAGNPVIVFQNLGIGLLPQWHFAVATGYDLNTETLTLHSGLREDYVTGIRRFERTWRRGDYWGLVVVPAGKLPATANEWQALRGAVGLERANRTKEAADVYRSVVRRWPQHLSGHMGLGNTLYALGDYGAAEAAFRGAIAFHPEAPDAWNNLAYALDSQKKNDEALFAAQKAILLADDKAPYRETLAEIMN